MNALPKTTGCPVELAIDLLRGKWKPVILARLKNGPMRYGELRRLIPAITDKILTEKLSDLRQLGFVEAIEGDRGAYRLTDRGEQARPMLEALFAWGEAQAGVFGVVIRGNEAS
jgi:DNA-binding HxlR family transcriptional regulator